jgi:hypothetical protein
VGVLLEENDRVNVVALTCVHVEQWALHDLPQIEHLTPVTIPFIWRVASHVGSFGGVGRFEQFLIKRLL